LFCWPLAFVPPARWYNQFVRDMRLLWCFLSNWWKVGRCLHRLHNLGIVITPENVLEVLIEQCPVETKPLVDELCRFLDCGPEQLLTAIKAEASEQGEAMRAADKPKC